MKQIERRLGDLERQNCTDEPPEDLRLHLHWQNQELTPEQQEANRHCHEWAAKHPGHFSDAKLEWSDELEA
jgi:hypothetical protein